MYPWIRLALKEFWLPFYYRKKGCPGGRDFVWLTTFMILLLTLILLLLASREGLLNRFVDVFLGNVPGYGVPVSVTYNPFGGGHSAITTEILHTIRKLGGTGSNADNAKIEGLQVYPYRPLEASLHPLIGLPDDTIWSNRLPDGSKIGPDFDGWAVYVNDPLWNSDFSSEDFPLDIILSRTLFDKYFDYNAYRYALQQELPAIFFEKLPEKLDPNNTKPLEELWLRVNFGYMKRELFCFRVTWTDRFPVIDKIAYLFPLTTLDALNATQDFPELRYYPEAFGKRGNRKQQILIEVEDAQETTTSEKTHAYDQFITKLPGEKRNYGGNILVTFPYPLRETWIDAYAQQYNVKYRSMQSFDGDMIIHGDCTLTLPCGRIPDDELKALNFTTCRDDQLQPVTLDVTAKGNGFPRALVYIPDRTLLSKAVDELMQVNNNALSLHPSYQDALNRFGFLSSILGALRIPYSLFLAVLLISFLGIQIATLIDHRRHRYGVFLAKGLEWRQIYLMLFMQIFMALIIGVLLAWGIMTAAAISLRSVVQAVAISYTETLSIAETELNLLPLTFFDYLITSIGVLLFSWVLAFFLLYRMPLWRDTHPAILLQ